MAPPAHRRSGVNKKAQLGVFTGYVVAGLGALFGGALLTVSLLCGAAVISFWYRASQRGSSLPPGERTAVAAALRASSPDHLEPPSIDRSLKRTHRSTILAQRNYDRCRADDIDDRALLLQYRQRIRN